jgi:hypothetical protein
MFQRQVTHPPGLFAACATCRKEPRHYMARGSARHEWPTFGALDDRHQLECVCERRTGWCNSLAEAVKTWGGLGETLPPANAGSNVHYIWRVTSCSGSLEQTHHKQKDDCADRGGDD